MPPASVAPLDPQNHIASHISEPDCMAQNGYTNAIGVPTRQAYSEARARLTSGLMGMPGARRDRQMWYDMRDSGTFQDPLCNHLNGSTQ